MRSFDQKFVACDLHVTCMVCAPLWLYKPWALRFFSPFFPPSPLPSLPLTQLIILSGHTHSSYRSDKWYQLGYVCSLPHLLFAMLIFVHTGYFLTISGLNPVGFYYLTSLHYILIFGHTDQLNIYVGLHVELVYMFLSTATGLCPFANPLDIVLWVR